MNPKTRGWLRDALKYARIIEERCRGITYEQFLDDEMFQFAVERLFERIGESLRRVRDEYPQLFEDYPELAEWISMRNFISHQYDLISEFIVWQNAVEDVPLLIQRLTESLGREDSE